MSVIVSILTFFTSPIGRWVGIAGVGLLVFFGAYAKGRWDGSSAHKAKIERQINDAISKGDEGRADALRKLNAEQLPDSWWRD
jgi:uncharacterized protein (DUF58 family)